MIPDPFLTPELEELNAFIDGVAPETLLNYPPLTTQDLATLGAIIQIYNFVELNLRRAIAAFAIGGVLPDVLPAEPARLSGRQLIEAVKSTAAHIHAETGLDGEAGGHLDVILRFHSYRNLLAHRAGRRVPGRDCLVLLGKAEQDAKQALGSALVGDEVVRCVVQASALAGLVGFLVPHERWVAAKTAHWYDRYVKETG